MDTRSTPLWQRARGEAWRRRARARWQVLFGCGFLVAVALLGCPRALGAEAPAPHGPDAKATLPVASRALEGTVWRRWSELAPASDLPGDLVRARPDGAGRTAAVAVPCNGEDGWPG